MQLQSPETARLYRMLEARGIRLHFAAYAGIGFHGTSTRAAGSIVRSEHFYWTRRDRGTLGKGVYFFDNKPLSGQFVADDFAREKHGHHRVATVRAVLKFEKLLDLTNNRNLSYFLFVQEWLVEQVRKYEGELDAMKAGRVEHFLIETCPEMADVDGVRWEGFKIPSQDEVAQIGFCVKKRDCIVKMRMQTGSSF